MEHSDSEKCTQRKGRSINDLIPPMIRPQQLEMLSIDRKSPLFCEACRNLGVIQDELEVIPFEEFDSETKDQALTERRYTHYQERICKTLNAILMERHRIKQQNRQKVQRLQNRRSQSHTKELPHTIPITEKIKNNIKKEQISFKRQLQREAQQKELEEIRKKEILERLNTQLEMAEKTEQNVKESKRKSIIEGTTRHFENTTKAKELGSEWLNQHAILAKRTSEDIQHKSENKAKIEQEKIDKYKKYNEDYQKRLDQIRNKKNEEIAEEEEKRKKFLENIEKQNTNKKQKEDKYLKDLAKNAKMKNERRKERIERIRLFQEKEEDQKAIQYRNLQNTILKAIVTFKEENESHYKRRSVQGPIYRSHSKPPLKDYYVK